MFEYLGNRDSLVHISVQHLPDQVDASFGERDKRYPKRVVENLAGFVKGVLLVHDRVQQDA